MTTSKVDVLVAGAGPTGLALSCFLEKSGISFLTVEPHEKATDKSKALGVHAGVLEVLEASLGKALVEELISNGRPTRVAFIHFGEKKPVLVNLGNIPSKYNFVLILEQSKTEKILENYLNKKGHFAVRGQSLLSFTQKEKTVLSTYGTKDSKTEVESLFLVGCDGAHSTTRHLANIDFEGAAYDASFFLIDADIDWEFSYDSVRLFVNDLGVIGCFPLSSEHQTRKYRIVLVPKNQTLGIFERQNYSDFELFKHLLDSIRPNLVKVTNVDWFSRFRVHHRLASHYQNKRVFLAGDAAHIHSPVGGQGMNTGIIDAFNLARNLKRTLGENSNLDLFRYENQRRPIGSRVVSMTDRVTRFGIENDSLALKVIRDHLGPSIVRLPFVQKLILSEISQVKIGRHELNR
ncbi:MAG: FAD-dependent monooxygenase [Bacteriovoracia bacterium]